LFGLTVFREEGREHAAHDDSGVIGVHVHFLAVLVCERHVRIAVLEDAFF